MSNSFQVTFDAADPGALARFWAAALGYVLQPPPDGFDSWEDFAADAGMPPETWDDLAAAVDPDGTGPRLFFQRVPEGKTAKNRVHLDIHVTEPGMEPADRRARIAEDVDRLVGLGARRIEDHSDVTGIWTVMQDPEGNEFCVE